MSNKNRKRQDSNLILPNSLIDLQRQKRELDAREILLIEKALTSNSPAAIVQAQEYIRGIEAKKESNLKAFTLAPEHEFYSGLGYKHKPTSITYDLLRSMSKTPQINAIIQTRIDQAMNYTEFTTDINKQGWTIQKRVGKFAEDKDKELTSADKREIEGIINFIEKGGNDVNEWEGDDWDEFRKKVFRDSWVLDQGAFETAWLRKGTPHQYQAVDGGSIRLSEQLYQEKDAEMAGYLPKYAQVWKSQVVKEFYPWEMCLGMRNSNSALYSNGYSTSELEILIQIVTWMLYGMQYNGNFFQQGSNAKGILNVKGNVDQGKIEEFKQGWRSTMAGVGNSHKLAVMAGNDVEWINMAMNNKDMEFTKWNEFLTVLSCTVFRIDPDEVGFHLEGSKGMFGQDGQQARLQHSKEKGLEPFLRYWQTQFDKYLVNPLSRGKYQFVYTGIDPDDDNAILKKDIKVLTNGGMSVQDFFMKYSSKELDMKKDILLNQVLLQYKQMDQSGSPESNEAVDQMTGEPGGNPYKEYDQENMEKSNDPFLKAFDGYLNKKLS